MTTSEEPAQKPAYNAKRSLKNYLIDSRLQLKYAEFLVLVTAVISAALFVFLWRTSRAVVRESQTVLERSHHAASQTHRALEEALKVSDMKRRWYVNNPMFAKNPALLDLVTEPSRAADEQLRAQQAAVKQQQEALAPQHEMVVQKQRMMLWGIFGGLLVLVVVVGLLSIFVTHKVAGPLYKMRALLRQVADGKLVADARLRKGDELQDFMGTFVSMVDSLRVQREKEITALDEAIGLARKNGATDEAITRLTSVRDELKQALEA